MAAPIPSDALAQLSALSRALRDEELLGENLAEQVKASAARARALAEEDIPSLMTELQLTEIKLETGEKITVTPEVYAAIPAAQREAAFAWLEAHGFGGLIKTEVTIAFGKEQLDAAKKLAAHLAEDGFAPELERNVHASTLKAWLKEQLEKAVNIPLELFGARPVKLAKVKWPKGAA